MSKTALESVEDIREAMGEMHARFRVLYGFANGVADCDYPHEAGEDLARGIQALYSDWHKLRPEIRHLLEQVEEFATALSHDPRA